MTPTRSKKKYGKMDPLEHILHRPDTYVGSTRSRVIEEYVSNENFHITKREIKYSPAILRIFVEPLSNAIDNVARSKISKTPCTKIKVNIDKESGKTTVWNDGETIDIEINEDEKCYNHTLIFGQLLTSSNYDDNEERYNISGRNGLGGKLCNVFSDHFQVRGLDPHNQLTFSQEWTQNMKIVLDPKVKKTKNKKGFTEVSWVPDFRRFGLKGYTQDIIDLYRRYVVDAAMLTGVDVYFNDVLIPVKNLKDYAKLYLTSNDLDMLFIDNKDAQIVLTPSSQFQAISFASGVYTSLGGTHVDAWIEKCLRPIVEKLSKTKGSSFTMGDVKKFFRIFVSVRVKNPEFESQSKHKLESPVTASVLKKHINKILKWSVIDDIRKSKEFGILKKLERKRKNFIKVDGLDPANNEGGRKGRECTLILVEGLSAKTYAVQGIEVGAFGKSGRDWFGIYALRGKVLNTRNASIEVIAKNAVVGDIIKALGIKIGVDYTDENEYNSLRYGRVMIITDADTDGIHISGLLQNMFHFLFPSVFERDEPFVTSMQTPIVRVFGKKDILFYDEREYHKYVKNNNGKINKKYYKGLGSSSSQDIADTFGVKLITYENDENTNANMNKVFNSKQSDARKLWLEQYDADNVVLSWNGDEPEVISLDISDFLDTEMIKFSIADCKRSIPGMMDGLKEGNRKGLFACFLRNLKFTGKEIKVAQLAGYVAEKSGYHHGEQNLYDTLTRMGNAYVGSNNIPLLSRGGQFGSRSNGGKDAASARYIFTKIDCLTRLLFRPEDDVLLDRVVDDGDVVEPKFYVPILPTILINGCTVGIGTGWSSSIPCYNPLDLIESVKTWIEHDGEVLIKENDSTISLLPEIHPWYRGFLGKIEKTGESKYTSWGNISVEGKKKVVDELPVGMWIDNFKEYLDGLLEDKQIKSVKNYSSPNKVRFVITETQDGIICNKDTLKLKKYIYTSNMVLFTEEGNIKKYDNVDEIINAFCNIRFKYYVKRKKHQLDILNHDIKFLGNKKRFLEEVMNSDIKLFDDSGKVRKSRKMSDIYDDLESRGYDKEDDKEDDKKSDDEDNEDNEDNDDKKNGYNYLLRLQFRSITEEKINQLKKDIASKIVTRDNLVNTSEQQIWINDLDEFQIAYTKWLKIIDKELAKKKRKK